MNLTCTFEISLLIGLPRRETFSMKYLNISAESGRKLEHIIKVNIQKNIEKIYKYEINIVRGTTDPGY